MTDSFDMAQAINDLSADDVDKFQQLLRAVRENGGDLSKLSPQQIIELESLKNKYAAKTRVLSESAGNANHSESNETVPSFDLKTPFSLYVKNVIHRELCNEETTWNRAVSFAFQNKWLPAELKNHELCETKYAQYKNEITALNAWRDPLHVGLDTLNDKTMAVGLAWFMKLYQFNAQLERE